MLRFVKQTIWLIGIIIGCQSAFGFALLGPIPSGADPADSFKIPDIGYALPGDVGTPMDIEEEYRRNTPVLYYAFDSAFHAYFQDRGVAEVDKAMAMFNLVTNVSAYSQDLTEFPLDSRRVNFRAAANSLYDLKSATMTLMTEQLGFSEPSRWVWAVHARQHLTGTGIAPCPGGMVYTIFQRNFSIVPAGLDTYPTTSYVNGVLYSYLIFESCSTTVEPETDAVEFAVDPLSAPYSAVADGVSLWYSGLQPGGFYTSLTRDDVGALRYLVATNNLNLERSGLRTTEFITNTAPLVITTLDLHLFAAQARTNDAAGLTALYPGLTILSTTNGFGLQVTTNITEILVNSPLDPAGFPPTHPFFSTNYTTNLVTLFGHTFGNLVTNTFATRGLVGSISVSLANSPLDPAGSLPIATTNVKPAFVNGVFGDFFILPTNFCSAQILSNLLTTVIATTNFPTVTVPAATNGAVVFTPGEVDYFTNHLVVYLPVSCPVDRIATRGGTGRIVFIKREYDDISQQVWDPVTNDYVLPEFTTNSIVLRHMQRRVARPDFLFTCADLAAANVISYSNTVDTATETFTLTISGIGEFLDFRTEAYDSPNFQNLAGPGTVVSPAVLPTLIILNKLAPLFGNGSLPFSTNQFFVDQSVQVQELAWGSFDGTTNAPVVYPNNTTLQDLENVLTGPASTTPYLPNAAIGTAYTTQITAQGGHPPYTFSLSPTSPGLPAGLNIAPNGVISGTPTGPEAIYDFTVRITDSTSVFRDVQYTITVF